MRADNIMEREVRVRVWSRAERRIVDIPWSSLERVLTLGVVDLLEQDGGLPFDRDAPPGRSQGDGEGRVYVRIPLGGGPLDRGPQVRRMKLREAAAIVRNGIGIYVNQDGSPLQMPQIDQEPAIEAVHDEPKKLVPASRLRKLAARLSGSVAAQ